MKEATLKRTLTLFPVVLFGLAYMAPMTVFTTYGVVDQTTHGLVASAYIFALIGMLFTAYSYGQMVKAYPVSGSAYTYTQKSINANIGFLVGWAILMDYLFIPMINYLVAGIYLASAFPAVPQWIWIVLFIIIITVINILGVKIATNTNLLMIAFQFLVVAAFLFFSIKGLVDGKGEHTLLSTLPFFNGHVPLALVLAGSSILCLSFLGFDSVSTFTEETIDAKRTIPRAIMLVTLIGGILFIVTSYFAQLVYPNFNAFHDPNSGAKEIAQYIGGNLFGAIFLAGMVISCFASALSSHASVARLLYAMGRDRVLPKKVFGYVNPRFRTPVYNILIVSLLSLTGLMLSLTLAASFINFGALTAFTFVNISVIAHYFVRRKQRDGRGVFLYLILPLMGAGVDIWLWTSLDRNSLLLGCIWTAIGFIYLMGLTRMFTKKPPELDFSEREELLNEPLAVSEGRVSMD
jgi:putrescine importer